MVEVKKYLQATRPPAASRPGVSKPVFAGASAWLAERVMVEVAKLKGILPIYTHAAWEAVRATFRQSKLTGA